MIQFDLRRKAAIASICVAGTLVALKLAAAFITGSAALLASMLDSAADVVASTVTLVAIHHSLQPADRMHRYGHGKAEALSALAQAVFIAGSGLFIVIDAIRRIAVTEPLRETGVGIVVMLISIALTLGLVAYQRHVVRRTSSTAIHADSMHYVGDIASNLAVLLTLIAVKATGYAIFDPICAALVAIYLLWNARRLWWQAVDMLMDHELPSDYRARVRSVVERHPEAHGIHDLRTRRAGAREFVEFHLELDGDLTLDRAHEITHEIEAELLELLPNAEFLIHQEPAGLEDERLDDLIRRA